MKITMYELIGLVKDGKAPKKIKYNGVELEYDELRKDYYKYCSKGLFEYKFTICSNFLNDEIEIIEEDKKIEKLDIKQEKNIKNNWKWKLNNYCISTPQKITADKINELIDEVNKLKEK